MRLLSMISDFPTRGICCERAVMVDWYICKGCDSPCLPERRLRLISVSFLASGEITSDRAKLAGFRIRWVPASAVSLAQWTWVSLGKLGLLWIPRFAVMALATSLANFRGYRAVYSVLSNGPVLVMVVPSMAWCSCWRLQVNPCNLWYNPSSVVNTTMPFFMNLPFSGHRNSPALHISNWQALVYAWISARPGCDSIKDLAGCSQWKSWSLWAWWRNNTIHKASWYSSWCRLVAYSCWLSSDLDSFNCAHEDHGPQSGLTHRCFGLWRIRELKSRDRPSLVARSASL